MTRTRSSLAAVLSAGDEVRSLLGAYCRLLDAGDYDGVGALMASAVLLAPSGAPLARGETEVAALYRSIVVLGPDGTPGTQHLVSGTELSVPDPTRTDRLAARSSYVVLQAVPDLPLQPVVTGSYDDEFALVDGAWSFASRRFSVGRTGDLSHHLVPGVLA